MNQKNNKECVGETHQFENLVGVGCILAVTTFIIALLIKVSQV